MSKLNMNPRNGIDQTSPAPALVREVPEQLQEMDANLNELMNSVELLTQRLEPVLSPKSEDLPSHPTQAQYSRFGEVLQSLNHRIQVVVTCLNDLERRAQL